MNGSGFIPFSYNIPSDSDLHHNSDSFRSLMSRRRSIRGFSERSFDEKIIENIIMTASSAPSGAHKQPWTFCVVKDPFIKVKIREAAEKEEYENYHGRMGEEWLKDLEKFDTNWQKDFLTIAPYLIIVFKKVYDEDENGGYKKNYYVNESVGIACGMLITAIHMSGLVTLTHTPSPMNFLQKILGRPDNERPFLLLPVGFPAEGTQVPALERKSYKEVCLWY